MTTCHTCRTPVPRGAAVCPHCLADRRLDGGRERREENDEALFMLGCFTYALPAAALWLVVTAGSNLGWWGLLVVVPLTAASGYRLARTHTVGTTRLAALLVLAAVVLSVRACRR